MMGAVLGQGLDNALVRQARDRLVDLMQVGGSAGSLGCTTPLLLCHRLLPYFAGEARPVLNMHSLTQ